jgi:hypothetical protein
MSLVSVEACSAPVTQLSASPVPVLADSERCDSAIPFALRWLFSLDDRRRGYERVRRQVLDVGGCARPIRLRGTALTVALASGLVVREFALDGTPLGAIPSFGAVHRAANSDDPRDRCYVRRGPVKCPHGRPWKCAARHGPGDPEVGEPLCPDCYDCVGHVAFNVLCSALFGNLVDTVYHRLAAVGGAGRTAVRGLLRVEYLRIAEYQARGVIHFHVIVRLDGPQDRQAPPAWATVEALADAVRSAAATVSVAVPVSGALGQQLNQTFYTRLYLDEIDGTPLMAADEVTDSFRPLVDVHRNTIGTYPTTQSGGTVQIDRTAVNITLPLSSPPP